MDLTLSGVTAPNSLEYRCVVGSKDTGWQASDTCNITGLEEGKAYSVTAYIRDSVETSAYKEKTTTIYTAKTVTSVATTESGTCPSRNLDKSVAATETHNGTTLTGSCSQTNLTCNATKNSTSTTSNFPTTATVSLDATNKLVKMQIPANGYYNTNAYLKQTYASVASTIGLTAAKIVKGNTILGIAGTADKSISSSEVALLLTEHAVIHDSGDSNTGSTGNLGSTSNHTVPAGYTKYILFTTCSAQNNTNPMTITGCGITNLKHTYVNNGTGGRTEHIYFGILTTSGTLTINGAFWNMDLGIIGIKN